MTLKEQESLAYRTVLDAFAPDKTSAEQMLLLRQFAETMREIGYEQGWQECLDHVEMLEQV